MRTVGAEARIGVTQQLRVRRVHAHKALHRLRGEKPPDQSSNQERQEVEQRARVRRGGSSLNTLVRSAGAMYPTGPSLPDTFMKPVGPSVAPSANTHAGVTPAKQSARGRKADVQNSAMRGTAKRACAHTAQRAQVRTPAPDASSNPVRALNKALERLGKQRKPAGASRARSHPPGIRPRCRATGRCRSPRAHCTTRYTEIGTHNGKPELTCAASIRLLGRCCSGEHPRAPVHPAAGLRRAQDDHRHRGSATQTAETRRRESVVGQTRHPRTRNKERTSAELADVHDNRRARLAHLHC